MDTMKGMTTPPQLMSALTSPVPSLSQLWAFLEAYGSIGIIALLVALLWLLVKLARDAYPTVRRSIRVIDTMLSAPEKLDTLTRQSSSLTSGFGALSNKLDVLGTELNTVKTTVADVKRQVLPNGGSSMRDDQHKLSRNVYRLGVALENYTGQKLELENTRPHRNKDKPQSTPPTNL